MRTREFCNVQIKFVSCLVILITIYEIANNTLNKKNVAIKPIYSPFKVEKEKADHGSCQECRKIMSS